MDSGCRWKSQAHGLLLIHKSIHKYTSRISYLSWVRGGAFGRLHQSGQCVDGRCVDGAQVVRTTSVRLVGPVRRGGALLSTCHGTTFAYHHHLLWH